MRALKQAAAVACAALLVAIGSSPASAAGATATNTRSQYIAKSPTPDAKSCIERRIYLASGPYYWYVLTLESGESTGIWRNITLAAGWYGWKDCLSYAGPSLYHVTSELNPDNPAYGTAQVAFDDTSRGAEYVWGSKLTPL
ncbi:hypothetical protein [Kitasatospora sp. NPDC051914]|uniref:hypothetical protein n=1 Tax=Kitasatospora sp. NPDC051914 TaxID=3154945 RepID=UPI0034429FE9